MCLVADKTKTLELQAMPGETIVYKVYTKQDFYMAAPYQGDRRLKGSRVATWGIINSNRRGKAGARWGSSWRGSEFAEVEQGIHVHLKYKSAFALKWRRRKDGYNAVIVKVSVRYADLVGVCRRGDHAAFTKVKLPRAEWLRVFPPAKKRTPAKRAKVA